MKTEEWKDSIYNLYCSKELRNLKLICDPLIVQQGIPDMYYDDLYSVAMKTLMESVESFDETQNCKFHTYLVGNIKRSFYDWRRDNMRGKRCNLQKDKNGRIARDEHNNVIIINNISIDSLVSDDSNTTFGDMIASNYRLDDEVFEMFEDTFRNTKFETYLNRLSKIQRKIVELLAAYYKPAEIQEILNISKKEYAKHIERITAYENTCILLR